MLKQTGYQMIEPTGGFITPAYDSLITPQDATSGPPVPGLAGTIPDSRAAAAVKQAIDQSFPDPERRVAVYPHLTALLTAEIAASQGDLAKDSWPVRENAVSQASIKAYDKFVIRANTRPPAREPIYTEDELEAL